MMEGSVLQSVDFFKKAKQDVIKQGYQWEIDICDKRFFTTIDAEEFLNEYAFVVISAGMKNQVAQKIYERLHNEGVASIGHLGKRKAIEWMQKFNEELHEYNYILMFNKLKTYDNDLDRIEFLGKLEWVGNITKYHLARNMGIDCAKPDRWLERLATKFGFLDAHDMCDHIAKKTGERIGTVDVILWRYCNLHSTID